MQEEDFEIAIKVLVVGNGGVGKSSLIKRFCKGTFTDQYKQTIGVDFLEKQQFVKSVGETVTLMLWDTAGQEEFDAITRTYYRGAGACVLAFSTTDRASYEAVESWKNKVEAECGKIAMVVIQNKIDLLDQAVVKSDEAEGLASKLGLRFYRTSVKEGFHVNEVFEYLADQYIKNRKSGQSSAPTQVGIGSLSLDDSSSTSNTSSKPHDTEASSSSESTEGNKKSIDLQTPQKQRTGGKKTLFRC